MEQLNSSQIAVFLDRDGTLCVDVGYLDNPEELEIFPQTFKAIKKLNRKNIRAILVTNQSGVARGFFTEKTLSSIHDRLICLLKEQGASLDNIYYCPHHPDDGCGCRKPKPGLLKNASKEMGIDLTSSYIVGDQVTDIELAHAVGAKGVLVMTGLGPQTLQTLELKDIKPHYVSKDIDDAIDWILKDGEMR